MPVEQRPPLDERIENFVYVINFLFVFFVTSVFNILPIIRTTLLTVYFEINCYICRYILIWNHCAVCNAVHLWRFC